MDHLDLVTMATLHESELIVLELGLRCLDAFREIALTVLFKQPVIICVDVAEIAHMLLEGLG